MAYGPVLVRYRVIVRLGWWFGVLGSNTFGFTLLSPLAPLVIQNSTQGTCPLLGGSGDLLSSYFIELLLP